MWLSLMEVVSYPTIVTVPPSPKANQKVQQTACPALAGTTDPKHI